MPVVVRNVTQSPTPSSSPTQNPSPNPTHESTTPKENPWKKFLLNLKVYGNGSVEVIKKSCNWLSNKPPRDRRSICRNKKYQQYSEEYNLGPASQVCFETCSGYCVGETLGGTFLYEFLNEEGEVQVETRKCKWLTTRPQHRIEEICATTVNAESIYGQAAEICTQTCGTCVIHTPAPTISLPSSPTPSPQRQIEDPWARFLLRKTVNDDGTTDLTSRNCFWLANYNSQNMQRIICKNAIYQVYDEEFGLSPASQVCFDTCADYCVEETAQAQFVFSSWINNNNEVVVSTKTCQWLTLQPQATIATVCDRKIDTESIYGQAGEICTDTCNTCFSDDDT